MPLNLIAAGLAAAKTRKVITTYSDGTTREHLTATEAQARNWAVGERRKIGKGPRPHFIIGG